MSRRTTTSFKDPLYGEVSFQPELTELARLPIVQRLRHIRLSNIDSLSMPSISNLSRFEHSLGVAYLASQVGFYNRLDARSAVVLQSSGLLHDTGITPFGHLAEEALAYVESEFDHEDKWHRLFSAPEHGEIGGFDLQLIFGRQAGLRSWADKFFAAQANQVLVEIFETIKGRGPLAGCIAGEMDLDNIDNVSRMAYHLGLDFDKRLPMQIASGAIYLDSSGVHFTPRSIDAIEVWLNLRKQVYDHLMLSREDFAGKVMLLWSMVKAHSLGVINATDWTLLDFQLLEQLSRCEEPEVSDPVQRWLVGDLWSLSNLIWMEGSLPSFSRIREFAEFYSSRIGRASFAYRIKDKRTRLLKVRIANAEEVVMGTQSPLWLLGAASPLRRDFTSKENRLLQEIAVEFFDAAYVATEKDTAQEALSLF
jgi:HD superfamily phosphohydrolase